MYIKWCTHSQNMPIILDLALTNANQCIYQQLYWFKAQLSLIKTLADTLRAITLLSLPFYCPHHSSSNQPNVNFTLSLIIQPASEIFYHYSRFSTDTVIRGIYFNLPLTRHFAAVTQKLLKLVWSSNSSSSSGGGGSHWCVYALALDWDFNALMHTQTHTVCSLTSGRGPIQGISGVLRGRIH